MNDEGAGNADEVQMFGDPRSKFVVRGPDRRSGTAMGDPSGDPTPQLGLDPHPPHAGRSNLMSTALAVLGLLVFGTSIIAGSLILYNAKTVGAFSNPWNSTRVAISLAVFALGIVLSAILLGLSRVLTLLLADRRRPQ